MHDSCLRMDEDHVGKPGDLYLWCSVGGALGHAYPQDPGTDACARPADGWPGHHDLAQARLGSHPSLAWANFI
jgi:hypothetical protein